MKKIVITTDQIHLHGGIEKVMATKVNYWVNLPNVEVIILTTEQNNLPPRYSLDNRVKLLDLCVNYNRQKSYLSIENIVKAIKHFIRQRKALKEVKPYAIISPSYSFDHFWLPFLKKNALLIKECHSSGHNSFKQRASASFINRIKLGFNDWIAIKYNYIIVLNQDEKQYITSENTVVIPNPIDLSDLMADVRAKQVIAAGRLSPIKQFDKLIEAWVLVYKTMPDWQLHIYGQDYLNTKQRLLQKITDLGLDNVVIIKDSVPNIPKVMTGYSIYAMTSESECFPMVLLEALSVGLPIVSFDCPNGPRNIIKNQQDGILVPSGDMQALADVLLKLMGNIENRSVMSRQAKKNIERFSTPSIMKQWQRLLGI